MSNRADIRKLLADDPEAFLRQSLLEPLAVLHVTAVEDILDNDAEALHDFRVAIRTLRSRLKFYAPYFANKRQINKWLVELSWLDKEIQPLRDIGVQQSILAAIALDRLQNMVSKPAKYQNYKLAVLSLQADLNAIQHPAHLRCAKAFESKRRTRLLEEIKTGLMLASIKPKRIQNLNDELHAKLDSKASRINRILKINIDKTLGYKKLHALRLDCKSARYLAEALGVDARALEKAQTLLGEINDLAILDRWLKRELLTRKSKRDRKVVMSLVLQVGRDLHANKSIVQKLAI